MQRLLAALLALALPCALARRGGRSFNGILQGGSSVGAAGSVGTGAGSAVGSGSIVAEGGEMTMARAMVDKMVADLIENKGPEVRDIVSAGTKHINLEDAVRHVEKSLPKDLAKLVNSAARGHDASNATAEGAGKRAAALDEDAIQRARGVFNGMVVAAEVELTDVLFECKEFQERNRGTWEQVNNDIARLGSQLASLDEKKVKSNGCIASYTDQYDELKAQLENLEQAFLLKKGKDDIELTRRKNDLAVFEFVLNVTTCEKMGGGGGKLLLEQKGNYSGVRFCTSKQDDGLRIDLNNPKLQAEIESRLTPESRLALRAALGQVGKDLGLVQEGKKQFPEPSDITMDSMIFIKPINHEPVDEVKQTAAGENARKCTDMPDDPDRCAKVHDTLSIEWGRFRDEVDELAAEMAADQANFDNAKSNFNDQMGVTNDGKTECMEDLAGATGGINADTAERDDKDKQARALADEYHRMCAKFKLKITTILYEKICEIITVRNAVLAHSEKTKPIDTIDCELTSWNPLNGKCTAANGRDITCDDTCPRADPNLCGGFETMKREIVVAPNEAGIPCGAMTKQKRCGQRKCPVDCMLSQWSGWSKCSRECEGGVQVKTRGVMTKPKNGGMGCDTVQEERSCNTGSCDRDCSLSEWSEWSPCSVACGGGFSTHSKSVLVPIRGDGKCPTKSNALRFGEKACNTNACAGDEICIAQQDLVIALDASGSLRQAGFDVLKAFAVNITKKYKSKYYGAEAVKMGAVLFGNGKLSRQADGSMVIAPALTTSELSFDIPAVGKKLEETKWQRGFTNMAQALMQAEHLLGRGGRDSAQSAVMVLSDGKPSFKWQTAQKAQELKDKNVQIFMVPVLVTEHSPDLETLASWASQPSETNLVRIPGFDALKENSANFVQQLLVKFCPDSSSPFKTEKVEEMEQFVMVREGGYPGRTGCAKSFFEGDVPTKDECAAKARVRGNKGFCFGKGLNAGKCLSVDMKVTPEYYAEARKDHTEPGCPGGDWVNQPYFDTYVLDPAGITGEIIGNFD